MKLIKAVNKQTNKVRLFASVKELANDKEVSCGRDPKTSTGNIYNALNPNIVYSGYNGWKLSYVEVNDSQIIQSLGL